MIPDARYSSSCETLQSSDMELKSAAHIERELEKYDAATTSWSYRWWTPTFIINFYLAGMCNLSSRLNYYLRIIALLIALTHLILFKVLDGAIAEGREEKARQTYINTASQLLANAFQICLQASLSTSFVQYL